MCSSDLTTPVQNDDWVCEYGQSQIVKDNPGLPPILGDHRIPRVYRYDTRADKLTELTDMIKSASPDDANRLQMTAGIRAAGNFGGVALLGGPAIGTSINLFAFDTDTGAYLGSRTLSKYGNIRHFLVADDGLYAGVGVGANGGAGGYVLRWTGSKTDPFSFAEVGTLPAQAADLALFEGRIFITSWPGSADDFAPDLAPAIASTPTSIAAVWMSPKLSDGAPGLNPEDAAGWQKVWDVSSYEPDPVIARAYALGGLAAYDGQLYWGTMHVPMKATSLMLSTYPPKDEDALNETVNNSQRAISIYRGWGFGSSRQKVDMLYGATDLPAYDPTANAGAGAWAMQSTHQTPLYGGPGFGNPYNNYTWSMVVAGGKLYVGTMDWSYLAKELGDSTAAQLGLDPKMGDVLAQAPARAAAAATPGAVATDLPPAVYGGDLYAFTSPRKPATMINDTGLGNYLNYGIRNMVADGRTVYLGMANPMNLRTDPTDDVPEGGWELIKLRDGR